MKTFMLILKGILFYFTILVVTIVCCGIDSIIEQGRYVLIFQSIILIALCYISLSKEDFKTLTFYEQQKKFFGDDEE